MAIDIGIWDHLSGDVRAILADSRPTVTTDALKLMTEAPKTSAEDTIKNIDNIDMDDLRDSVTRIDFLSLAIPSFLPFELGTSDEINIPLEEMSPMMSQAILPKKREEKTPQNVASYSDSDNVDSIFEDGSVGQVLKRGDSDNGSNIAGDGHS